MYSVWIPLSLMGKLDNIGADDGDISFDNEGSKESDWYNPLPRPEREFAVYAVRRSPSIIASPSPSTPKSILKVRSYPSVPIDRSSKIKRKKAASPRGESCAKIPNESKIRFDLSMSENGSEDEDEETETAKLLPPPLRSIEVVAVAVTSGGDSSHLMPDGGE
jgi:hypothetical protein